jgi:hypothetical protein
VKADKALSRGPADFAPGDRLKSEKFNRCAFVIGGMKCGSTTLFDLLAQHPELCASSPKETGYFVEPEKWASGPAWFDGCFDWREGQHSWALEATTDHAKLPYFDYALDRIAGFDLAERRFIYVIRNPFKRIESHHNHARLTGHELSSFRPERESFSFNHGVSQAALNLTRYAYHIEAYQERFGADSLLTILFEDLAMDSAAVLRRCYRFLGIEEVADPPALTRSNARDRREPNPVWKRARSVGPVRDIYRKVLPQTLRQNVADRFSRVDTSERMTLTVDERAEITKLLGDDWRRLRDVHGLEVERAWGLSLG